VSAHWCPLARVKYSRLSLVGEGLGSGCLARIAPRGRPQVGAISGIRPSTAGVLWRNWKASNSTRTWPRELPESRSSVWHGDEVIPKPVPNLLGACSAVKAGSEPGGWGRRELLYRVTLSEWPGRSKRTVAVEGHRRIGCTWG
jgi:hypothetical protein